MNLMIETMQNFKKEPSNFYRWLVLVVASLAMFGNYYIYDSISPLADLLAKQLKFTDSNIGLLQGIYSLPNIIMVLIGGLIIDKVGTKKSALLFASLCMLGAFVTAISSDIILMASGRLIFGLGAESLIVAITTTIARWFKGKELSFAFGLNLTIARLGSFAALNSPSWAIKFYDNYSEPLWLATIFGLVSLIAVAIYYIMDTIAEKNYNIPKEGYQDKLHFEDIFSFNPAFWYITALCVTFYSAIFPFQTFAVKFFIEQHNVTREIGGFLSSMLTLFAMFLTPIFGLIVDKIGKRSILMMIGSAALIPVYMIMVYTDINLYIPMGIMGFAFSLVPAVMWPTVALVVDNKKLGTAYGLMTMIQNIGLTLFNLMIGAINDVTGGYNAGMWIFSFLGFLGLFFSFLLSKYEKKYINTEIKIAN